MNETKRMKEEAKQCIASKYKKEWHFGAAKYSDRWIRRIHDKAIMILEGYNA